MSSAPATAVGSSIPPFRLPSTAYSLGLAGWICIQRTGNETVPISKRPHSLGKGTTSVHN
jgi:hypothetical protein